MHKAKQLKIRVPWSLLAVVAVYLIFSEMYVKVVVPRFNWGGMILDQRSDRFVEYGLLVLASFFMPSRVRSPADFYNWIYFLVLLIPSSVLSAEQGSDRFHLFLMFVGLWILMLFHRIFRRVISRETARHPVVHSRLPYYPVFVFVIAVLLYLAVSVHGAFNLNFYEVYDFRFDISESMPLILRYLMHLASGTLIGYLGAMASHRKDIKCLLLIAVAGILFFGFSSHKSMLFNPLAAMTGYFLFKMSRPHLLIMALFSFLSILIMFLPEEDSLLLGSLYANRLVFIPSQINFFYFDFFSNNPMMLWAESKISFGLVSSELPMGVMNYIGGLMTGNYSISANTGWVANAYMNAGVAGIVLYAVVIGFLFALIDFWAGIHGKQLVGAAFLVPVYTLTMSADLLIVLLTTGLFALLVIFHFGTWGFRIRRPAGLKKKLIAVPLHA